MSLLNNKPLADYRTNQREVIALIVENLNHVFNSKTGYSYFNNDFGIADYSHLSSRDDIAKAVIAEVSRNIALFEPRLQLLGIDYLQDKDPFRLSFRINCVVRNDASFLNLVLNPSANRYQVSPP